MTKDNLIKADFSANAKIVLYDGDCLFVGAIYAK